MLTNNDSLFREVGEVEEAIAAAVAGDLAPFRRLHGALSGPFDEQPENRDLTLAPRPDQRVRATFCGT